jgi:hypothetical protein
LAGGIIDRETGASSLGVEASRRLKDSWTLEGEIRGVPGTKETDPLHGLRKDTYIQMQLKRHF